MDVQSRVLDGQPNKRTSIRSCNRKTLNWFKAGVQDTAQPDFGNKLYALGQASDFDMQYALDTHFFWQFLQNTQEEELEKLKHNSPNDWQRKMTKRLS